MHWCRQQKDQFGRLPLRGAGQPVGYCAGHTVCNQVALFVLTLQRMFFIIIWYCKASVSIVYPILYKCGEMSEQCAPIRNADRAKIVSVSTRDTTTNHSLCYNQHFRVCLYTFGSGIRSRASLLIFDCWDGYGAGVARPGLQGSHLNSFIWPRVFRSKGFSIGL